MQDTLVSHARHDEGERGARGRAVENGGCQRGYESFLRSGLLPSFAGEQTAAFYLRASVFYGLV